jgi:hypothetical protein
MTIWKLYRYEDMVYAPTMVVTDEGVFIETQPVQAVSVDAPGDVVELVHDLLSAMPGAAQESDLAPPDTDGHATQPVLLEILGIKRWHDFEKRALMYTLHKSDKELTLHITGRGADGMWSVGDSKKRSFPQGDSPDEIHREIANELVSRRPVESPKLLGSRALMPAPPADAN